MRSEADITFHVDKGAMAAAGLIRARGFAADEDDDSAMPPGTGCVLDGYDFDAETPARYAGAGPLVFLHDLGPVPTVASLVVNGGFQMVGASLCGIPALLGPAHALIAAEFRPDGRDRERVETVLVSMGRADAANATGLALEALLLARAEGFAPRVLVALGADCPHLTAVKGMLERFDGAAELHVDTFAMTTLMNRADLIIGAGGVGLQERVAMAIPSVTLVAAENQAPSTVAAVEKGLTALGLPQGAVTPGRLRDDIVRLAADPIARRTMAARGPTVIDGKGPARVATALKTLRHSAQ